MRPLPMQRQGILPMHFIAVPCSFGLPPCHVGSLEQAFRSDDAYDLWVEQAFQICVKGLYIPALAAEGAPTFTLKML